MLTNQLTSFTQRELQLMQDTLFEKSSIVYRIADSRFKQGYKDLSELDLKASLLESLADRLTPLIEAMDTPATITTIEEEDLF